MLDAEAFFSCFCGAGFVFSCGLRHPLAIASRFSKKKEQDVGIIGLSRNSRAIIA